MALWMLCGQTAWAPQKAAERPLETGEAWHDPPPLARTWTPLAAQDNGNTVPWQGAGWQAWPAKEEKSVCCSIYREQIPWIAGVVNSGEICDEFNRRVGPVNVCPI